MSLVFIDWWDGLVVHGPRVETALAKKIIHGEHGWRTWMALATSSLINRSWA
jgi:hypothetical protein